jgi:hypothetical protein
MTGFRVYWFSYGHCPSARRQVLAVCQNHANLSLHRLRMIGTVSNVLRMATGVAALGLGSIEVAVSGAVLLVF